MTRRLKIVLAACLSASCFVIALSSMPISAADDEIIALDKAATSALSNGDKAAQSKYLDSDFSWVDTKGVMRFGDDSFAPESSLPFLWPTT